ncbi:thioredoxin, mitochondrial isoform X2 [Phascolarctos cinereus]
MRLLGARGQPSHFADGETKAQEGEGLARVVQPALPAPAPLVTNRETEAVQNAPGAPRRRSRSSRPRGLHVPSLARSSHPLPALTGERNSYVVRMRLQAPPPSGRAGSRRQLQEVTQGRPRSGSDARRALDGRARPGRAAGGGGGGKRQRRVQTARLPPLARSRGRARAAGSVGCEWLALRRALLPQRGLMAQRVVLRRFLAPVLFRKLPRCRWGPLPPEVLAQGSSGRPAAALCLARTFSTTKISKVTFNVQDGPDFQDRVVNSDTPVVVDFHAQCLLCRRCWPSRTGTWWTSLWASRMKTSWRRSSRS